MSIAKSLSQELSRQASFLPSRGPALGLPSPLGAQMTGQRASSGSKKKDMHTPLLLTALVDAFSILVIFLLVQISAAPNSIEQQDRIKLPQATTVDDSSAKQIVNLVVEGTQYLIDGKIVSAQQLPEALKQAVQVLQQKEKGDVRLVIHADDKSDFDMMSPLLASTAQAGISKLEFAVENAGDANAGKGKSL